MRKLSILLLTIIFFCGCSPYMVPHQQEAVDIIWFQTYNETKDPPDIGWQNQDVLDCYKNEYSVFEGWSGDGECLAGLAYPLDWYVQVSHWSSPDWTIDKSALAHEYWHIALFIKTGDADPDHTDPSWGPGGIVSMANNNLIDDEL